MEPFVSLNAKLAPLNRVNVDTDQIIPKQFLKRVERTGFGQFLFNDWRFMPDGSENKDFILNQEEYSAAEILVSGRNFGSGSSREHAPWALQDYGFKCIIAPSFGDIFFSNCFQNGVLPVVLHEDTVAQIIENSENDPEYRINIDLESQRVWDENEEVVAEFSIEPFRRHCMLNGLDDIGLTLEDETDISVFESGRSKQGGVLGT
ncbi:MAG: 3-isopropylmalate dehydratase small subunit [Dehalococcoidia bacterium]|jgi:3-isopropylmalate/(R)-2-methylmalate dehydratase small subunit|uniref:3-isopropylmalate dehydratase n=1 Tax=marine metagenome TaxID=408172 RepID=A0A382C7S7_9ZZZZ|nr:3-isopropylmalate dehydratase small subunit [Chloroflexota bacterium]MBH35574.1 3-isopropylmalate dehydratase small subunit [Dehalococcoidia bacterium]MCH2312590.1 3-isopropylmalate dehydratase small subunit [SAR202 cluster bacterium]MBV45790.1 3-isopropylmalate dehydratase small subunit [Dehalococcoidia bacterium]MCS5648261.1 3-isopropylmalate dehydratase small subunit [Dehalococcoidia bacterium]|tara:strand:+ start:665 stop:1279 length:615 start_codon:yes stop_codon:yes gene_type:complete